MKIKRLAATTILVLTLFIYPNLSHSAVETCNLEGFENFESAVTGGFTALDPILFSGGGPFVDWETSQDLTSDTGASGSVDYSSGCPCGNANASCMDSNCNPDSTELNTPTTALNTCGPDISAFGGIIDPLGNTDFDTCDQEPPCVGSEIIGSDCDDFITYRLRLNGDPQSVPQANLKGEVWQLVIDLEVIDSAFNVIRTFDGFNDFLVSVDGTFSSGGSGVDRIFVQFNNNGALQPVSSDGTCTDQCNTMGTRTQNCEDIGIDCFIVDEFTACGQKLTGVPGCMADNLAENCNKSFSRTKTVANTFSCPSGSSQANEYYLDVMIPITAFVDQHGYRQIYCNTDIRTAISSSTTAQDTFLKDAIPDCTADEECGYGITTPITLANFKATSTGNEVLFEWTTSTETANAGFNIYSGDRKNKIKLNSTLIPTKVFDSLEPVKYTYSIKTKADTFYISDVDVNNNEEFHGPFKIGNFHGSARKEEKLDWAKISSEHKAAKTSRQQVAIEKSKKNKANILNKTSAETVNLESAPGVRILVENDGIHRVSLADISAAGLDLTAVPAEAVSLTNRGVAVPFYLDNSSGGAIEFIGESIDSLYTKQNVYLLNTGVANAPQIAIDSSPVKNANNTLSEYTETLTIDNNRSYSTTAANGDPWYDIFLIAFAGPASAVYSFELDNITDDKGIVTVEVNGPGNIPNLNPDHHVTVSLNGVQIADELFEGFESKIINVDLKNSGASLINGTNELIVTLPGDLSAPFDLVFIDKLSITYSRTPVAVNNLLTLDAKTNTIAVYGFDNPNITVYRDENGAISRLSSVNVTNTGGKFKATFKGIPNSSAQYYAATDAALFAPVVEPANTFTDINTGNAEYLIISHPDFISGLGDLVDARTNISNFNVKVVNSEDIYDQYNFGIFDPQAIKNYITDAINNMGTEYILLVGADTRDYKNFLNKNTISFIPTLYATSEAVIHFAPSDPLLADIDGDMVQDAAIGRFPVRTQADLVSIISKTLNYPNAGHNKKSVFAADSPDSIMSFSALSNFLIENLPSNWQVSTAYIEELGLAGARAEITNSINNGVAYTSYFGHSDLNFWSFSNLFNNSDISALTNAGLPTVVSQYGCWNTYYVHEDSLSMAHKFLLEGDKGAAAVMGPSTRTSTTSDNTIGETIQRNLIEHQMPIGKAIMEAKQQHKNNFRNLRDVMVGWVLLGDPALELAD